MKKSFLKDLVECQEYTLKTTKILLLSLYWLVKQENCLNSIIFPNWPNETRQLLHFCPEQASEPYLFSQSSFLMIVGEKRRRWHPTPVLLPGKSRGRRSLVSCSPWDREELDTTKWLHFNFSFSCIGEGNGNPLQCSCLENPRDGAAWWAAVYGVAQSRTRLKRLSSSSSNSEQGNHLFPHKLGSPKRQMSYTEYI